MSAPENSIAPSNPIAHSEAFRLRRFLNWFPLGLAYAFLYMGRYNLTVSKNALGEVMTKEDFGWIFGAGTLIYGVAFVINGPITDRMGGKRAILIALLGSAVMNLAMGGYVAQLSGAGGDTAHLRLIFSILYAANMYFQSFGAVAIVKVNAHWFHVRERGGFSGIFGTMISSGIFFAFTVNAWILDIARGGGPGNAATSRWVFFAPAAALLAIFVVELLLLKDTPSQAGLQDFDTGDASSGEDDSPVRVGEVIKRILSNPVIRTIALIEFCTGVLRNGVMHWYPIFTKEVLVLPSKHPLQNGSWERWWVMAGFFAVAALFFVAARAASGRRRAWFYISGGLVFLAPFLQGGWGGILMVAGVIGGNAAGWVSDLFFQSRRAPAAGGMYFVLTLAALGMYFTLGNTTTTVAWADADKKAVEAGLDSLKPGDRIVSIAGKTVERWRDVTRAVSCLPAVCRDGSKFDLERCICTQSPTRPADSVAPTGGVLPARVVRDGAEIDLRLRDTGMAMRAGDSRTIKAGPVLTLSPFWLGGIVFVISICVIGTHGVLSGTATMDFGGRKGAATAVGLIDGCVYLGTALQSTALGALTSWDWRYWPLFLLPFAIIGFVLSTRIWHAKPTGRAAH